jgi:hypothetical protein
MYAAQQFCYLIYIKTVDLDFPEMAIHPTPTSRPARQRTRRHERRTKPHATPASAPQLKTAP